MVQFEMLDETASNGKSLLLSRRYTMSADPKSSLRQDLESWLGRTLSDEEIARIDLSRFLGEAALLAIRHEARGDKIFANITSVLKPPSGREQKARPDTPMVAFSLQQRPFDGVGFARLPQWLQTVIANAPEYKRARDAVPLSAGWPSRCVVSWKPLLLHPCHMLNHSPVPQRANTLYLLLLAVSGC
jgi:hypothetical protein